jgi:hypothetical protein
MNRWLLSSLLAWCLLFAPGRGSQAASLALGGEVGLSVSRFAFDEPKHLPFPEDIYGSITWLRGSVRGRIGLNPHLAVVTGVSYESNGFDAQVTRTTLGTVRLEYVMVPVLLEIQVPNGSLHPFGRVGVESGLLVDADEFFTVDGDRVASDDPDVLYSDFEWNLFFGAGIRVLERWDVHVGYRYGLANINEGLQREVHHFHNRSIVLGLTYWWRSIGI